MIHTHFVHSILNSTVAHFDTDLINVIYLFFEPFFYDEISPYLTTSHFCQQAYIMKECALITYPCTAQNVSCYKIWLRDESQKQLLSRASCKSKPGFMGAANIGISPLLLQTDSRHQHGSTAYSSQGQASFVIWRGQSYLHTITIQITIHQVKFG